MENAENRFKHLPKIIFLILGVVIVVEVIFAGYSLMQKPSVSPIPSNTILPLSLGKFNFELQTNQVEVEETLPINLVIDTGGYTIASASVAVKFDPEYFEGTASGYINVNKTYPDGFNGIDTFTSLNLKAKKAGSTVIETSLGQMDELGTGKNVFSSQYTSQEIIISQ